MPCQTCTCYTTDPSATLCRKPDPRHNNCLRTPVRQSGIVQKMALKPICTAPANSSVRFAIAEFAYMGEFPEHDVHPGANISKQLRQAHRHQNLRQSLPVPQTHLNGAEATVSPERQVIEHLLSRFCSVNHWAQGFLHRTAELTSLPLRARVPNSARFANRTTGYNYRRPK